MVGAGRLTKAAQPLVLLDERTLGSISLLATLSQLEPNPSASQVRPP